MSVPIKKIREIEEFYKKNSVLPQGKRMDCITSMNAAIKLMYNRPDMPLGDRIDRTMNFLISQGLASGGNVIEFINDDGKITTGVTEPARLSQSVYGKALMISEAPGWNIFGMSVMDGYHAVLLVLNTDDQKAYWCDQWGGDHFGHNFSGWTEFDRDSLDEMVTRVTNTWWNNEKDPKKKPRTRLTLWKIIFPA